MSESITPGWGEESFVDELSKASPEKRKHSTQFVMEVQLQQNEQSNRRRLDTEETYRIKNIAVPVSSDPNAATMINQISPATDESYQDDYVQCAPIERDDDSVISSLTSDEDSIVAARRNTVLSPVFEDECSRRKTLPPVEVEVPFAGARDDQSDSLMERLISKLSIRQSSSPLVQSVSVSSLVERPSMGRNRSCPVRMDFSVTSSSMPSSSKSGTTFSIPEESVIINGVLVEGIRNGNSSKGENSEYSAMLGNRKRRVHRRVHSGTEISVGSIVGQSTLLTAPSTPASFSDSDASSVRKALRSAHFAEEMLLNVTGAGEGMACCQVRRQKNIVKEELKYVAAKLASPIRKIPMFSEKKAQLKRSSGSLV